MNNTVKNKKSRKPEKARRKFTFIDFVLIVLVLAIITGGVYVFLSGSIFAKIKAEEGTVSYTVEIRGVDAAYIDKIKENDVVVDGVTKSTLGTVIATDYNTKETSLEYVVQEDGTYLGTLSEHPNQYTVFVIITAPAKHVAGDGYFVNDCRIAVGEKMSLHFPDFAAEGYCISVIPENFQ